VQQLADGVVEKLFKSETGPGQAVVIGGRGGREEGRGGREGRRGGREGGKEEGRT